MHSQAVSFFLATWLTAASITLTAPPLARAADGPKINKCEFRVSLRRLWADHVGFTREFIIDKAACSPETDVVAQRLLRNQKDISDAIVPFYGADAGARLLALLTEHVNIGAQIVDAAIAQDAAGVAAKTDLWNANGDAIAAFLNAANPDHWALADMQSMMRAHLSDTAAELNAHLNQDWAADLAAYDQVMDQAMMMADMLAKGIMLQHPTMFSLGGCDAEDLR